jgi:uncharacterized UPF0160 family protein
MTTRRSSFTKSAALKYVRYYDQLIEQLRNPNTRPTGMFLSAQDFGNVKVSTLHNRFRDALNWLKNHNLDDNNDRRKEYEFLAAVLRVNDEASGIRVTLLSGPPPQVTVRAEESVAEQMDWKQEVQSYLQNPDAPVKVFQNCKIFPENVEWLKKVTGAIGASFYIEGDRITIATV